MRTRTGSENARATRKAGPTPESEKPARPVMKWVGGKARLVPKIVQLLPEKMDTYFEPFVGGAAVFFHLAESGRFRRAVLSDRNDALVELYRAI